MPNIYFTHSKSGTEVAYWPGATVQTEKGPRKKGHFYLGKVISWPKKPSWLPKTSLQAIPMELLLHPNEAEVGRWEARIRRRWPKRPSWLPIALNRLIAKK